MADGRHALAFVLGAVLWAVPAAAQRSCDEAPTARRVSDAQGPLEGFERALQGDTLHDPADSDALTADLRELSTCSGPLGRRALLYLARLYRVRRDREAEQLALMLLRASPMTVEEQREVDRWYPTESARGDGLKPERAGAVVVTEKREDTARREFEDAERRREAASRERLAEARRDSRRRARAERMATARAEAKNSPLLQRHAGFGISLGARRVDRIAGPLGLSYASDFEQDLYIDFLFGATFQIGLLRLAPRVNMLYAGKKDEDSGEDTRSVGFGAEMVVGVGFQNRYVVPHIGARLGLNSLGAFVAGPEGGLDVFVGDAVVLGFYGGAFLDPSMWGGGGGVTLGLFPRPR